MHSLATLGSIFESRINSLSQHITAAGSCSRRRSSQRPSSCSTPLYVGTPLCGSLFSCHQHAEALAIRCGRTTARRCRPPPSVGTGGSSGTGDWYADLAQSCALDTPPLPPPLGGCSVHSLNILPCNAEARGDTPSTAIDRPIAGTGGGIWHLRRAAPEAASAVRDPACQHETACSWALDQHPCRCRVAASGAACADHSLSWHGAELQSAFRPLCSKSGVAPTIL